VLSSAAGGLVVTISGENLDAGRSTEVSIAPMNCELSTRFFDSLICTLSAVMAVDEAISTKICLKFDSHIGTAKCASGNIAFGILPNPITTSVTPNVSPVAGGVVVSVGGTNFQAVQAVSFNVLNGPRASRRRQAGSILATGTCNVTSAVALGCKLPSIPVNGSQPQAVVLQLLFDGHETAGPSLTYFPNPVLTSVSPLTGSPGDLINLGGEWLQSGGVPTVLIGGVEAEIVSVQDSSLTVEVPPMDVVTARSQGQALTITLVLGDFETTFERPFAVEAAASEFPLVPVAGGVGGAFALLVVAFVIAYTSQRGKKRRQVGEGSDAAASCGLTGGP